MPELSESELLARCRQGDPEAWDRLFDQHYAAVGRFVGQLSPDFSREDIEEIAQEVFLAVIKHLQTFKGQSRFQTWVFRIAANKAKDHRQRQLATKRGGGQMTVSLQAGGPDDSFALDPPSPAPGPDVALIQSENLALVGQALALLGNPCQEVIELRYFGDLSYEEIAGVLSMNPKTVSSRLSKCLDKLEGITAQLLSREKNKSISV